MMLKMTIDYCCGGGHCGPVPGYEFTCPECGKESACRTGFALKVGQSFACLRCKSIIKVNAIREDSLFEVETEPARS